MISFSKITIEKLKEILLLNAYTVEPLGYVHGKTGIALTFFELARYINDDSLENHAFDLLQETLTYDITINEFSNGKAGIAYVVHYLIKNQFLDANYLELYGEQHENIIDGIISSKYEKQNPYEYIDDLFFILSLSAFIPQKSYNECLNVLSTNIYGELDSLYQKANLRSAITFYDYASRLLSTCCSVNIPSAVVNQILYKIINTNRKLLTQDCICEHLLYPVLLYICSKKQGKEDIQEEAADLIGEAMQNVLIPALNFRQKTDLIFNIFRLYGLERGLDFRNIADDILQTITDSNNVMLEQKIYDNIFRDTKDGIGIGAGVSRLILLAIYWDEIHAGNPSENIIGLFS